MAPSAAHAFPTSGCRERIDPDQVPPDYFALCSLALGIMGLMLKVGSSDVRMADMVSRT
jgi:hypothetical protein